MKQTLHIASHLGFQWAFRHQHFESNPKSMRGRVDAGTGEALSDEKSTAPKSILRSWRHRVHGGQTRRQQTSSTKARIAHAQRQRERSHNKTKTQCRSWWNCVSPILALRMERTQNRRKRMHNHRDTTTQKAQWVPIVTFPTVGSTWWSSVGSSNLWHTTDKPAA